jgi:hypothetical protein
MDIDNKLNNYLKITDFINNVLRPQETLKNTRIKLYNSLPLPALSNGSENRASKVRHARRITATEMKYMEKKQQHILGQIIQQTQGLQKN